MQAKKERVLLVDDEPQILLALEDLLSERYTVFKTESPQQALELVNENSEIAVVLTDQRMPQMNGDEFLRKITASSQALRIMVSGFADLPSVLRAVNEGKVFAYVTKPWDEDDLLSKVQTAAEHFRLTQQLEYERRLLKDLMDNSPDGIYFKDTNLRFLRANAAFAETIGRATPEELVGWRISELLGLKHELAAAELDDRQVLRERQPSLDVVRQYRRGGQHYFTSETKAAVRNAAGSAIGLVGISRDVTARVKTSFALRESEALLQQQTRILNSILDGIGDGVVVTTKDGRTLLLNKQAKRLLGVAACDVAAEDWPVTYGLCLSDAKTLLSVENNPLCRAMNGEALVQMEICVENAAVSGAMVAMTATPLKDPAGTVVGAIALLRDVTQQRTLEKQLIQAQKMEAIGQLAGGVAHDFNNLLTVIVGCGELAIEDLADGDTRRDNIVEVLSAARRASLLTQQLLTFGRRQIIQPKDLQLNEILTGIESTLYRLIGGQIKLETALRPELCLISADQSQIEQIILNLVVNARDAMPEGGVLRIETENLVVSDSFAAELGILPGRYVALSVKDTGTGMTEETRKRVFEPFFTTKEVGKGTGLGLSTVYGIVRQNKGHIRVCSAHGAGTEFRILLPETSGQPRPKPSLSAERRPNAAATILLIEGDDAVRQTTARMLRSEGHSVLEAARLDDARALLAEYGAGTDVLLTDIGTAGATFLAELATSWPNIRIVFMTGGGPVTESRAGLAFSDSELVAKPFSRAQLLEKVASVLMTQAARKAPHASP